MFHLHLQTATVFQIVVRRRKLAAPIGPPAAKSKRAKRRLTVATKMPLAVKKVRHVVPIKKEQRLQKGKIKKNILKVLSISLK